MTGLAIPEPGQLSLFDIQTLAQRVHNTVATIDDVKVLRANKAKLSALDLYLERTAEIPGRKELADAMRDIDVRIGELSPPTPPGQRRNKQVTDIAPGARDIPRRELTDARKMAANKDVVEQVKATSTEDSPASARKVIKAIDAATKPAAGPPTDAQVARGVERLEQLCRHIEYLASLAATQQLRTKILSELDSGDRDLVLRTETARLVRRKR